MTSNMLNVLPTSFQGDSMTVPEQQDVEEVIWVESKSSRPEVTAKRVTTQDQAPVASACGDLTQEQFTDKVLREFQPMFRYISAGRYNRIMSTEDYVQEISTHVCRVISQRFDEMRVFTPAQLRASVRTMATNLVSDLVGFYTRRPDTSVIATATSIGNTEETETDATTFHTVDIGDKLDAFREFQFQFDINVVELTLSKFHEPYCPGITRYFKECIEPSPEVADAFLKHRLKQKRQRNMKDGYIPPTILAQLIGLPLARVEEYKQRIRSVLHQYDMIPGVA